MAELLHQHTGRSCSFYASLLRFLMRLNQIVQVVCVRRLRVKQLLPFCRGMRRKTIIAFKDYVSAGDYGNGGAVLCKSYEIIRNYYCRDERTIPIMNDHRNTLVILPSALGCRS